MKINIEKTRNSNGDISYVALQAVDEKDKDIFGATASIARADSFSEKSEWIPGWSSNSSRTFAKKEVELKVIQKAFAIAKEMNRKLISK